MIAKARARFSGGALHPLEPLDLAEGQEVVVSVEEVLPTDGPAPSESAANSSGDAVERARKALRESAGGWKGKVDGEAMKQMLYEARRLGSREVPDS